MSPKASLCNTQFGIGLQRNLLEKNIPWMFPCLSITDLTYIILQGMKLIEHLNARRNSAYDLLGRILRTHIPLTAKPAVVGRRAFSGKECWQEDLGAISLLSPSPSIFMNSLVIPLVPWHSQLPWPQKLYADYKSHNGYKRIFLSCYPLPKWNLQLGFL